MNTALSALRSGPKGQRTVTILYGHPDTDPARLCHSIMNHYARAVEAVGAKVNVLEIGRMEFGTLMSAEDQKAGAVPTDIDKAQDAIAEADRLVLIFPLWLGSMPGRFKMFLEQVFRPGFAYDFSKNGQVNTYLKGKSADVIVTMGMPPLFYKWFFRAHGMKNLKRNILNFIGVKPVRFKYIGMVDKLTSERADELFLEIERYAAR